MKKLMLIATIATVSTLAFAQKSREAIIKSTENAQAACNDAKKGLKVATWITAGKTNIEAYQAPMGQGVCGISKAELELMMNGKKPVSTTDKTIGSDKYTVESYEASDYYYKDGILQFIYITEPYVENALETAFSDFVKAHELDVNGSKTKDISEGLDKVSKLYQDQAFNEYTLKEYAKSSKMFRKAVDAAAAAPLNRLDTSLLYNAGMTAFMANDIEFAIENLNKCLENNYYEKGAVFARLANCYKSQKDTVTCKSVLEKGFAICPDNQEILIGLINLYLDTNDDPQKLFALIQAAEKNEPNNASLYYVEGNLYKQFEKEEDAVRAYSKCSEVNPDYEFGHIGIGIMYYEKADKIRQQAEMEFDDKKYEALVEKYDDALILSIEHLEKGFNITTDQQLKVNLSDYLKSILYRFRDKGSEYKAAYEKYDEYFKSNSK